MRVLPDDLVAKCLAMLPQCDLQERCVCKRWRELRLSSPAFRRYRRDGVERVADGVWTALPPLPEIDYMMQCGWPGHDNANLPSGYYHPRLASLPLEFFADDVAVPWPFRLASTLRGCAAPRRPTVFRRADSPDDDATPSDP